jgi:hypothetical protein
MNLFDFLATIVGDLLLFIIVMLGLLIGLLVWMARLPPDNPVRRILHALALRVGAMLGAGTVAIPVQPIPGIDVAYDLALPALVIYLAFTFFREVSRILKEAPTPAPPRIDYRQAPRPPGQPGDRSGRELTAGRERRTPPRLTR